MVVLDWDAPLLDLFGNRGIQRAVNDGFLPSPPTPSRVFELGYLAFLDSPLPCHILQDIKDT